MEQNFFDFDRKDLKKLYSPPESSHKGNNGKLMIIGGSKLFHSASLWSLKIASRFVDMVFYSSVSENNDIVHEAKKEFRDGIVVPRENIEDYINESDCVLIGPGLMRTEEKFLSAKKADYSIKTLSELNEIEDEGVQTYYLTKYLLSRYKTKKWVIDGGSLQMMEKEWLLWLSDALLTPHSREFERLFGIPRTNENVYKMSKQYNCIILAKGHEDVVCSPGRSVIVKGGNPGMTKGGTGDVLAGLAAALCCKSDMFIAACCGSFINKRAGDRLFDKVGYNFNASDLADEIPAAFYDEMNGR